MSDELPKGWVNTNLEQLVLHKKGKKPEKTIPNPKDGYVPYILIDEMEGKAIRAFTNNEKIPIANEDDVLIVWDGSIGKTATGLKGAIGSTIAALSPIAIKTDFLNAFLQLSKPKIEQTSRGTGLQHINPTTFWPLKFPLPPLNEQKRIVAKLDHIMPKIDDVKERLEHIPQIIKRFRQSVLTAAVNGKLTEKWQEEHPGVERAEVLLEKIKKGRIIRNNLNRKVAIGNGQKPPKKIINLNISIQKPLFESEWPFLNIGDLFDSNDIFDGPFGSNLKTSDYTKIGVRVVRLENIGFLNFINEKNTYVSEKKYETLKKHTVKEGNIIFSSFISENVRTVVLPELGERAIAKADCFCLRPIESLIDGYFFAYILTSQIYHDYLQSKIHGATRPRINTTQLKKIHIPLPPLEEQKEIVRQVDKLFAFADKLEKHYQQAKEKIDKLPQSVLAKVFRGELVLQDPNDEPAEKLLERIKEEKARLESEMKKTRRKTTRKKK